MLCCTALLGLLLSPAKVGLWTRIAQGGQEVTAGVGRAVPSAAAVGLKHAPSSWFQSWACSEGSHARWSGSQNQSFNVMDSWWWLFLVYSILVQPVTAGIFHMH